MECFGDVQEYNTYLYVLNNVTLLTHILISTFPIQTSTSVCETRNIPNFLKSLQQHRSTPQVPTKHTSTLLISDCYASIKWIAIFFRKLSFIMYVNVI